MFLITERQPTRPSLLFQIRINIPNFFKIRRTFSRMADWPQAAWFRLKKDKTIADEAGNDIWRNTDARSRNRCCSGKAVCITCSECVSVALDIQHATRVRRVILSCMACLALPYFSVLSHKRHDSQEQKLIEYRMCVPNILYKFCLKHLSFYGEFIEILLKM